MTKPEIIMTEKPVTSKKKTWWSGWVITINLCVLYALCGEKGLGCGVGIT